MTPDAEAKTRFVLIDAVGVTESLKTVSQPLERDRAVAFDKLIDEIAAGAARRRRLRDPGRPAGRARPRASTTKDRAAIAKASGGVDLPALRARLLDAIDPDTLAAPRAARRAGYREQKKARDAAEGRGCNDPSTTRRCGGCSRTSRPRPISGSTRSRPTRWFPPAGTRRRRTDTVERFKRFLEEHREDSSSRCRSSIGRPMPQRRLTYEAVEDLRDAMRRPPWLLEPVDIWRAYKRLDDPTRCAAIRPARSPTSSCWCATRSGETETLEPLPSMIAGRFNLWLGREEKAGRDLHRRAARPGSSRSAITSRSISRSGRKT